MNTSLLKFYNFSNFPDIVTGGMQKCMYGEIRRRIHDLTPKYSQGRRTLIVKVVLEFVSLCVYSQGIYILNSKGY